MVVCRGRQVRGGALLLGRDMWILFPLFVTKERQQYSPEFGFMVR